MRYFFVDTENVQKYNFINEMKLVEEDKIIIFMSKNSKCIRIEDMQKITTCKSSIQYESVDTGGKNAMDFQIISYLGLLVGKEQGVDKQSYHIVSNDNDFKIPIKYLKDKADADISIVKTESNKLSDINDNGNIGDISVVMNKSKNLCEFHNTLIDIYGKEEGKKIYQKYKPKFKLSVEVINPIS